MNQTKQFVGFLSSVQNPGQLSLTVASFSKAILGAVALFAAVRGLDAAAVTSQVQNIIDVSITALTAGFTAYHTVMTVYGLVRKLMHTVLAKPVVTQAVATPVAVTVETGAPVI